VNAAVFALLMICTLSHELTAIWDVRYANSTRQVDPLEQHLHGVLENLPFIGVALLALLYWPALAQAVNPARWLEFRWKEKPLPLAHIASVLVTACVFGVAPYLEALTRTVRRARAKGA
jgi:hypothetical protein